jgi:hypothetical protein
MKTRPLACPTCDKNDWVFLRASDTGAFALDCESCHTRVALGEPRDVPTLTGKGGDQ